MNNNNNNNNNNNYNTTTTNNNNVNKRVSQLIGLPYRKRRHFGFPDLSCVGGRRRK